MLQSLPKLCDSLLEQLKHSSNLLAFSAGSDSSALFFILKAYEIPFDIALVNYQTRKQSNEEEEYAKELAKEYNKNCFIHTCNLDKSNFEHEARKERYAFFEKTIEQEGYENLLTAHHLNDRLEWFLMQLSKGAGVVEMIGMQEREKRKNYSLIRPLLPVSKKEINDFLQTNSIKHFLDASNEEKRYKRNRIREEFSTPFLEQFEGGVKKSFTYLQEDAKLLRPKAMKHVKKLFFMPKVESEIYNIRAIDKVLKELGYLLSAAQREEILKTKSCIIAKQYVVEFSDSYIFISPTCKEVMPKSFKEECRVANIPSKIRPYMYKESISPSYLLALMS